MRARLSFLMLAARTLLVPYLIVVLLLVWLPASASSKVTGIVGILARKLGEYGFPTSASYTVLEFLANVTMFVPLGVFVALGWPRLSGWVVVLIGYATSVTIELVQLLMPSRFATISDVIANTLGAAIGVAAIWFSRSSLRGAVMGQSRHPRTSSPSIP